MKLGHDTLLRYSHEGATLQGVDTAHSATQGARENYYRPSHLLRVSATAPKSGIHNWSQPSQNYNESCF